MLPDVRFRFTADDGQATAATNRVTDALRRNEAAANRASAGARGMSGSMATTTRSSGQFTGAIQNAAFQVGDFAVQVGGGTSALRAMSQQLPQLLGGFGVFGAVAGAAFAVLAPLVGKLFEGADAARGFGDELSGINPSLEGIRGSVRQLGDLQASLNAAISAQGAASAGAASAVIANSAKEFDARRQILEVEVEILRIRSQEKREALQNLRDQASLAAEAARERVTGLSVQDDAFTQSGGLVRSTRTSAEATLLNSGINVDLAEKRRLSISKLTAELQLLDLAAREGKQALDGVFDPATVGGDVTGGGSGGRSRPPILDTIEEVKAEISGLTALTQGELGAQLGAWGRYFTDLQGLSGSNSNKLAATAKALAAAEATVNAYRAATQALADPTVPFWGKIAAYGSVLAAGLGAVNAIKSVSTSGGGGGAARAGGGAAAVAAVPAAPTRTANIFLQGDVISGQTLEQLFKDINKGLGAGYRLNLERVGV